MSAAAFPGADREERLKVPIVHVRGVMRADGTYDTSGPLGFERHMTVNTLTANVLCKYHDNSLSEIDTESGTLREAIDGFWDTWMRKRSIPGLLYTRKVFEVDGPRMMRWFMKSLFTQMASSGVPIGGPHAEVNTPTDELVDIVYGKAPPRGLMGLYAAAAVNEPKDEKMTGFAFQPWEWIHRDDPSRKYIAGCLAVFKGFRFALNLDPNQPVPVERLRRLPGWNRIEVVPLGLIDVASENVALRFNWPDRR